MPAIVILTMHRSGSSLIASIIQKLGVHIGDELLGKHPSQPRGHFENVHFYRLNMDILREAGGNWQNIPSYGRIMSVKEQFAGRINRTISQNRKPLWGWKDPRTSVLLPLYLPYLKCPRFILVYRDVDRIANSLLKRSGGTIEKWKALTGVYHKAMEAYTTEYPILRVNFEDVVTRNRAETEVEFINIFVGGNGNIKGAMELIEFRQ